MKFANLFIYRVIKTALVIGGGASFLSGLVLLYSLVFFHPAYFSSGKTTLGLSGFMHGYPLSITHLYSRQTGTITNLDNRGRFNVYKEGSQQPFASGSGSNLQMNKQILQPYKITGESYESHILYVQPSSRMEILMIVLPWMLVYFVIAWCCLQLFHLVKSIHIDKPFMRSNPQKVRNIGIAIVCLEAVLFFIGLWIKGAAPSAFSLPDYVIPDSPFNLQWLLTGFLILSLTIVFSRGRSLKIDYKKSI